MKKIYLTLSIALCAVVFTQAQSVEELKAQKADLAAKAAEFQSQADALNGQIADIDNQLTKLAGWRTGLAGNVGFDFNKSSNWIASPNPSSSSTGLGIGLTGFANKLTDKALWNNKAIVTKAWQDIDISEDEDDGLEGTIDILNISSLYGYRVHPKFAISALGELNTSVENFLEPGAFDIGVGGTWTPTSNLVVVVHPFNYHIAWPADGTGVESSGALGAKIRADYTNTYNIGGKAIGFSSTFTTFQPYSDKKTVFNEGLDTEYEAGLAEYTWVNTVSFELLKGIGVGVGFGLRSADFEILDEVQSYYNLGLTYNITK